VIVEWATRATIWLAMSSWVAGIAFRGHRSRAFWTAGAVFYLLHILFAYAGFYDWSHRIAWEKTAADTAEATGFRTGVGLLLNFLFAAWLGFDLWNQWTRSVRKWRKTTEGLVLFFIVNGAIVFGDGPVVLFGIFLTGIILASWIIAIRKQSDHGIG
jgi:hypothetical protein